MKYGYARISTINHGQSLDRQFYDLLNAVPDLEKENIYTDTMSGRKKDRPGLNALKEKLQAGDILYVESLSRLSRSTQDLLETVQWLDEHEVALHSLKEHFDFTSATGKLLLTFLAALSEFEASLLRERVAEGLNAARANGKVFGRPRADASKLSLAVKLYNSKEYKIKEITEMTGISRATLYRELQRQRDKEAIDL